MEGRHGDGDDLSVLAEEAAQLADERVEGEGGVPWQALDHARVILGRELARLIHFERVQLFRDGAQPAGAVHQEGAREEHAEQVGQAVCEQRELIGIAERVDHVVARGLDSGLRTHHVVEERHQRDDKQDSKKPAGAVHQAHVERTADAYRVVHFNTGNRSSGAPRAKWFSQRLHSVEPPIGGVRHPIVGELTCVLKIERLAVCE